MYVRTISRRNKDDSTTANVQLAHNIRDPKTGFARANVLYSFGRADSLDVEEIKRLAKSLCRFLSPEDALHIQPHVGQGPHALRFLKSSPLGGAFVLRALWERLGLEKVLFQSLGEREFRSPMEWALFAMVANRALDLDSKRAVEEWVREDVVLGNREFIFLQHLYRAMDFLLEEELMQKEVFFATADVLHLEVDLLFFDTTTAYVERDEEDERRLRRYGHSKEKRPDLPQVVIGLAVTQEGLPVRCWVLPGNTQDMSTVERVKKDLRGWKLSQYIWVMDRGRNSEENRMILQRAGGYYILGEKLRDAQREHREVLSRPGRYQRVRENPEVKEVILGAGERRRRFILAYNPDQAKKDKETRERTLKRMEEALSALGDRRGKAHKKAVCALLAHPTFGIMSNRRRMET